MKKIFIALVTLSALTTAYVLTITPLNAQPFDPREKGIGFYTKAKRLKDNIQKGWRPGDVVAIMGPPEEIRISAQGPDTIEVWGYDGFEVRIVFQRGLVSDWNFRMMR